MTTDFDPASASSRRSQIGEQVIKDEMGVDRRESVMFAGCFTDPVYADFSGGGVAAATFSRADLVARSLLC